jgi:hypothetical protein
MTPRPCFVALAAAAAAAALAAPGCKKAHPKTLDPGESATVTFLDSDFLTEDLAGPFMLTEDDLVGAMGAEISGGCLDAAMMPVSCYPFSAYGCRWIGARISSDGTSVVTAAPDLTPRNNLMICQSPTGRLLGSDDRNPDDCVLGSDAATTCMSGSPCAPLSLTLDEDGDWICLFTVSPVCATASPGCSPCFAPNEPVGGDLRISVDAPS